MRSCAWMNMSPVMCGWMRTHYVPAAPSAGDGGAEVVGLPWCGRRLISEPLLCWKCSFCQDGLGTNIGKVEKKTDHFLQAATLWARSSRWENGTFWPLFILNCSFYQDRLGTHTGKALKMRCGFLAGVHAGAILHTVQPERTQQDQNKNLPLLRIA